VQGHHHGVRWGKRDILPNCARGHYAQPAIFPYKIPLPIGKSLYHAQSSLKSIEIFTLSPVYERSIVISMSVCLSVCLSERKLSNFTKFSVHITHIGSSARASSGRTELHQLLPVLRMTSSLHTTAVNTATRKRRILKQTSLQKRTKNEV